MSDLQQLLQNIAGDHVEAVNYEDLARRGAARRRMRTGAVALTALGATVIGASQLLVGAPATAPVILSDDARQPDPYPDQVLVEEDRFADTPFESCFTPAGLYSRSLVEAVEMMLGDPDTQEIPARFACMFAETFASSLQSRGEWDRYRSSDEFQALFADWSGPELLADATVDYDGFNEFLDRLAVSPPDAASTARLLFRTRDDEILEFGSKGSMNENVVTMIIKAPPTSPFRTLRLMVDLELQAGQWHVRDATWTGHT